LLRLKGETLAMKGRAREAERWLREAVAVAGRQEAKLFELRSTVSLCRLLPAGRAATVVRDLLAPVVDWFAADVVAPDLAEARTLLAAVAEPHMPGE
jgi:hypothetical protein